MCGLAGEGWIVGRRGESHVRAMVRMVAHRGPDGAATLNLADAELGFVRLSLVDPAGGDQPLSTPEGDLHLIANGEIYNHRELEAGLRSGAPMRTGSDCEVLLHLYRERGMNFLDDVRGMFAFVLYDSRNRRLLLARDKFGIKPLFLHRDDDRVIFGSEIKALFTDPRTPRTLDWQRCLADQMMTSEPVFDTSPAHSWFRDISLVPAGCIVAIELGDGTASTHRYWDFPAGEPDYGETAEGFVDRYREALAASVADCGMADVEVGLLLSGGIDSAAVGRLAQTPPRSFTVVNGSVLANGDAQGAHLIAAALGLTHHLVVIPDAAVPSADAWRRHVWLQETPLAGPESYLKSELYRYVRAEAPEVKAMYLGGGADEFNGGYTSLLAGGGDWNDFIRNITGMSWRAPGSPQRGCAAWLDYGPAPLIKPDVLAGQAQLSRLNHYHRWKYRDVQQYNCWHEDRNAAGSGIEARVPFLDSRLIDVISSIPEKLAAELLWDKLILRRAMIGILPEAILNRPKTPFFYGSGVGSTYRMMSRMLMQADGELVEQALSARGAGEVIDAANARLMLAALEENPSGELVEFALRIVNLGLLQAMADETPAALVDWDAGQIAERIVVRDWDNAADELSRRIAEPLSLADDSLVILADNAQVLRATDDTTYFIAIDAAIEYVIDAEEDADWLRFLLAIDGERTLAESLAAAGTTLDRIGDTLRQALDERVLVLAEAG